MAGNFLQRAETFGLDSDDPWALSALRLVFSVPRAYEDLVNAWEIRHKGTKRALERLVELGFVAYQKGVVVNTITGEVASGPGRAVTRWRLNAKGRRALASFSEDLRNFEEMFPRTNESTVRGVIALLSAFDLDGSHVSYGMSAVHALGTAGIEPRLGRWWLSRFEERDWVVKLEKQYADTREVVPAHWRVTRALCRQLDAVIGSFPNAPASLRVELRIQRSRFLADIDPARIGITGATDFDHDIEAQRIVAAMLRSPKATADGQFAIEPRLSLPIDRSHTPWRFTTSETKSGTLDHLMYQPDALLSAQEIEVDGKVTNRRVVRTLSVAS
jgi:hypothetical protein